MSSTVRMLCLASVAAFAGSACSVTDRIRPYRMDVRQGNYVSQSMLAQLSPGMTQEQVRFIMGSPLLIDPFHPNRWDYVYRLSPGRGEVESRRIALIFNDGKLSRIEGDVVPADGQASKVEPAAPRVIEITEPGKK